MKILKQKSSTGFSVTKSKANKESFIQSINMIVLLIVFIPKGVFSQAPTINSFSPMSGPIVSTVNISGSGFNTTLNQNIVFFGATKAAVIGASANSLTGTVPIGATHDNLSVTNLSVNLTAYSSKPFIVTLSGNFAFASKVDFAIGMQPYVVNMVDLDDDDKTDILL